MGVCEERCDRCEGCSKQCGRGCEIACVGGHDRGVAGDVE